MPHISETKARLLHGAVQDNVAILQGTRIIRQRQRARRRYDLWLLSAVLVAGLTYLLGPALWRGPVWVQNSLPSTAVANVEPVPEANVPLSDPRPIDRSAIPLSIKTIVIDPGHGGDPGTTAESGLTEKEITLDVA